MPAILPAWPAIMLDVRRLLGGCQGRLLASIEADDHDLKLLAGIVTDAAQTVDEAVQHLVTQHGAAIIRQNQNEWITLKIIIQGRELALLVTELQLEGTLGVELVLDLHFFQDGL